MFTLDLDDGSRGIVAVGVSCGERDEPETLTRDLDRYGGVGQRSRALRHRRDRRPEAAQ